MSLAGTEGQGPERNTSWGGSSNTSWGGSSNTSWGGSSNTSWGGSSNTSWGGGRGRAAIAALALALPVLAALPFAAHGSASSHTPHTAALISAGAPVHLDGVTSPAASATGRLNVRELSGAKYVGNGKGQTIAVLDSGVNEVPGLTGRVVQGADFTGSGPSDVYGHGTFVASLAAGNGRGADGSATGVQGMAPDARIVSVKVADNAGRSTVGRVVAGLAWVIQHRAQYGITVVNMSLQEANPGSYLNDPVDALAEAAWFSGITVVASSGNDATTVQAAPGNDPFVITVGSVGDSNTLPLSDDATSPFSNAGTTPDGFVKPEVSTFGEHVQAALPGGSVLAGLQKASGLPGGYGQMSGTSMSTGVAAGAVALLRAIHPTWTPGMVKGALMATRTSNVSELRLVTAASARPSDVTASLRPSLALAVAYAQKVLNTRAYSNVTWSDVTWSDVTWSDVTWSDVVWSDVSTAVGTAATWSDVTWSDVTWSDVTWSDVTWSDATWSDVVWSNGLCCGAG